MLTQDYIDVISSCHPVDYVEFVLECKQHGMKVVINEDEFLRVAADITTMKALYPDLSYIEATYKRSEPSVSTSYAHGEQTKCCGGGKIR